MNVAARLTKDDFGHIVANTLCCTAMICVVFHDWKN